MTHHTSRPRVIIVGAGFGGIYAARTLERHPVDVLLIDRNNYHTFTPLLYQVATCGLEAEEIAYPVRGIFRGKAHIAFMLAEVIGFDLAARTVRVETSGTVQDEPYDYLIVAGGSVTNDFNLSGVRQFGFGLKDLNEAIGLRSHILTLFERAQWTDDPAERAALVTLVVVGGGPTGLEMAGALVELYTHVLQKEYSHLSAVEPRVLLIEATDRLLAPFPPELQQAAVEQLRDIQIEVIFNNAVSEIAADHVTLRDARVIPTHTLIWAAGVKASPLASLLGVPLGRGGRVPVLPTMALASAPDVYVVGDMAYLEDAHGQPYPMLIPVAKQQGILAAGNIARRLAGKPEQTFRYIDRGIMATIGRSRAVAYIFNRFRLRGFLAWTAWLGLHLVALMGFRNRVNVFVNWVAEYLTYDRAVRIILGQNALAAPRRSSLQSAHSQASSERKRVPDEHSAGVVEQAR